MTKQWKECLVLFGRPFYIRVILNVLVCLVVEISSLNQRIPIGIDPVCCQEYSHSRENWPSIGELYHQIYIMPVYSAVKVVDSESRPLRLY